MRRPIGIAALVAVLIGLAWPPAVQAGTTIRLEPFPVAFPGEARTKRQNVSIWVDNIPSPGLGSFNIHIDPFPRLETGSSTCMRVDSVEIDPGLKAVWGGSAGSILSWLDSNTEGIWRAWKAGQSGTPLPTGTIRLGQVTFVFIECGLQGDLWLNPSFTKWGSGFFADRFFDEYKGAPWIGYLDIPLVPDVTATCDRISPPGDFIDGDLVEMACTASNLGTASFGNVPPLLMAVFSSDGIFDKEKPEVFRSIGAGVLRPGQSNQFVASARPVRTSPGVVNICTKIDVDLTEFDQGWGTRWEADETNNTECHPMTVLAPHRDMVPVPGSVHLTPDPRDPDGFFRAGLDFQVTYDVLNRGPAAVRFNHTNRVLVGSDFASAAADPNGQRCDALVDPNDGLPMLRGEILTQSFGLGSGISSNRCKIPFRRTPGDTSLFIQIDAGNIIPEDDPNQVPDPAETNNVLQVPFTVMKPLDPQFRIQHKVSEPGDQRVEIFGPATGTVLVAVASATGLTSYGFSLGWDPALLSLGDPALPGGDPSQVTFRSFLEQGGLVPSCAVTSVDPSAGSLRVECTTSDPSGTGKAAWTEFSSPLLDATFTPLLPGGGAFTISNVSATDEAGQPFTDLRVSNGTFFINGVPELFVLHPVPAPAAWPGVPFSVSFDLMNDGFGQATPPLRTELIVSEDPLNDPQEAFSDDLRACIMGETAPLPGKTTVGRTLTGCRLDENVRPGLYTGFFQVQGQLDTTRRSSAVIPFPARVLALRASSRGRRLEVRRHPTAPGGTAGPSMVGARKLPARSVVSVGSESRNRNWMVHLRKPRGRPGKLFVDTIPTEPRARRETLRSLRVAGNVREVLAGTDIDGDGEDELMLLLRSGKEGTRLDFRRIDFTAEFPAVCPSAAVTGDLGGMVVAAAGLQADGDPEDEIAVLDRDGVLTLYDVELQGAVPPAEPCTFTALPLVLEPPGTAVLTEIASDTGFGTAGDEVRSICALDYDLDGRDEIAGLHETGGGAQALRIYAPPASVGGSALPLADDPEFGGSGGHGTVLWISCTR